MTYVHMTLNPRQPRHLIFRVYFGRGFTFAVETGKSQRIWSVGK